MMNFGYKNVYFWLILTAFILGGCGNYSGNYEEIESSTSSENTSTSSIKYLTIGGSGSVYSSADGIAWTERTSGTSNSLNDVVYQNGVYMSVGESGTIVESSDGISWITRATGTTNKFSGVTYGASLCASREHH